MENSVLDAICPSSLIGRERCKQRLLSRSFYFVKQSHHKEEKESKNGAAELHGSVP